MRDTIDMAREAAKLKCDCCLPYYEETDIEGFEGFLKRFEALVRDDERDRAMRENAYVQAEREACAKVCENDATEWGYDSNGATCAIAIRARGNT